MLLVFPFSDGVRLWASSGQINYALIFTLGGGMAALRGVRTEGAAAWRWAAAAAASYALGVLQYEQSLGLIGPLLLLIVFLVRERRSVLMACAQLGRSCCFRGLR